MASEGAVGLPHQLQVSAKLVISPDPLLPPQRICNCATANDTELIFISKTNERHLKVGRSPECLCFDCCRSLRGDACSQESLGQSCHGAFAATFNSLQPQQSCVDNPHGQSICQVCKWLSIPSHGECTIKTISIWSLQLSINTGSRYI